MRFLCLFPSTLCQWFTKSLLAFVNFLVSAKLFVFVVTQLSNLALYFKLVVILAILFVYG